MRNSFVSGENYSLKDLFSDNHKIIIPDLQRDYCWGKTNGESDGMNLVQTFVENLLNHNNSELNLGLLYAYEAPTGHVQLCDGQQRITTLFLLLGHLNKRTENDDLLNLVISKQEQADDWEPYLQYSIRESSLYFLSDLTRKFFRSESKIKTSDIRKQPWYFKDYDYDPSIQSMIAAMQIIEDILDNRELSSADFKETGLNIASNLSIMTWLTALMVRRPLLLSIQLESHYPPAKILSLISLTRKAKLSNQNMLGLGKVGNFIFGKHASKTTLQIMACRNSSDGLHILNPQILSTKKGWLKTASTSLILA